MKSMFKLLGIIAFVAIIGFTAACSNGSTGGPGSNTPRPVVPLKETYVNYDSDGNKYELVITENTTGRALDPNKIYIYKLTITFTDGKVAISTGVAELKPIKDDEGNLSIDLKHTDTGITITITVSSSDDSRDNGDFAIESVSDKDNKPIDVIPVDNDSEVKDVPIPATSYRFNDTIDPNGAGIGYILIKGEVLPNGVAAPIPEKLSDGKPVIGIGWDAFANNKNLRSIEIPAHITHIGWWGNFYDCINLTTVTFAAGSRLEHIGGGAFTGCTSLSAIEIPASVKDISGWGNFERCTNLKTVTFESGSKLQTIGAGAFSNCTSLSAIEIPASVTTLEGWGTFWDCTNLKTVTFATNSQIKAITGGGVFAGCTSINEITIPASVTTIEGWGNFAGWTSSQTINIYQSRAAANAAWSDWLADCGAVIKYWNGSAFVEPGLEYELTDDGTGYRVVYGPRSGAVNIPASYNGKPVTEIGDAFNYSGITGVTIPNSVKIIGGFWDCANLATVTFEAGSQLEEIAYGSFGR